MPTASARRATSPAVTRDDGRCKESRICAGREAGGEKGISGHVHCTGSPAHAEARTRCCRAACLPSTRTPPVRHGSAPEGAYNETHRNGGGLPIRSTRLGDACTRGALPGVCWCHGRASRGILTNTFQKAFSLDEKTRSAGDRDDREQQHVQRNYIHTQRTQSMCQNESRHTVRRVSNGVGNRLALGPRSRYQKLNHDLDPSAWYKATDGFGPSRTDAQADQALCFPVLCGDTCMRVWSSKHRGLSARRAALPWNLAFWLSITTATRPARY